jgi:membrane protein DedA with SNARE-associated domain
MTAADFIAQFGWVAVFIGALLEGETVVLIAAVLVQQGFLDFESVLLAAAVGAFAGDQFFFHLGRYNGRRLFTKYPSWQRRLDRAATLLARRRRLVILLYRFIYGMRAVIPFMLGSGNCEVWSFTALSAFSAMLWAAVMGTGGYWFGDVFQRLLRQSQHIQRAIICGGILLLMVVVGFRWWRRRSSDKDACKTKS